MRAIITVGLGYGDEGKGATTQWLVKEFESPLVIRYSGGAQCGHNVVSPDGKRHAFAQWGAGTFQGAGTYLDRAVIVNPLSMQVEARRLMELGVDNPWRLLTVHPDCLLATPLHIAVNRAREQSLSSRHGSCGAGIGFAREYWIKYGHAAPAVDDLFYPDMLEEKLRLLQYRARLEFDIPEIRAINPWDLARELVAVTATDMEFSNRPLVYERFDREVIVFEGAQGVLLDEHYGDHPHTTWSDVTPREAFRRCARLGIDEIFTLGVTRTYATRHGDGPLAGEPLELQDDANQPNEWQGSMRFAKLESLARPCQMVQEVCRESGFYLNGLAVNCIDQLPMEDRCFPDDESLPEVVVEGHGPAVGDRAYRAMIF